MTVQQTLWGGAINLAPTEAKVERILESHPETRSSDRELILAVWLEEDGLADILHDPALAEQFVQWFRDQATFSESIARVRRKLQGDGRYLPPEEAQLRRAAQRDAWRECFRR